MTNRQTDQISNTLSNIEIAYSNNRQDSNSRLSYVSDNALSNKLTYKYEGQRQTIISTALIDDKERSMKRNSMVFTNQQANKMSNMQNEKSKRPKLEEMMKVSTKSAGNLSQAKQPLNRRKRMQSHDCKKPILSQFHNAYKNSISSNVKQQDQRDEMVNHVGQMDDQPIKINQ